MKLFSDWVVVWSDDQKNYFILRLKDIDQGFSKKYENYLEFGKDSPDKDYFEPGVPPELDLSLTTSSLDTKDIPQPKKISFKEVIVEEENEEDSECTKRVIDEDVRYKNSYLFYLWYEILN